MRAAMTSRRCAGTSLHDDHAAQTRVTATYHRGGRIRRGDYLRPQSAARKEQRADSVSISRAVLFTLGNIPRMIVATYLLPGRYGASLLNSSRGPWARAV